MTTARATLPAASTTAKRAAVMVPLYEHDDELFVVLTRRPLHMRRHAGEISFPGGGFEAGDTDLWATARRETSEEIGLDPERPELIGQLDLLFTRGSDSLVAPFVADLGGRPDRLTADPTEVDAILHVPITELLLPEVFHEEVWQWKELGPQPMSFFSLVGDTVWGATAAMLRQLLLVSLELEDSI